MEVKTCKRCGATKPLTEFRDYYGGKPGKYTFCKTCEKIEARRKYLRRKPELSVVEQQELNEIERLYEQRKARGLTVPRKRTSGVRSIVEDELNENM